MQPKKMTAQKKTYTLLLTKPRLRAAAPPSLSFVKPHEAATEQIQLARGFCRNTLTLLTAEHAAHRRPCPWQGRLFAAVPLVGGVAASSRLCPRLRFGPTNRKFSSVRRRRRKRRRSVGGEEASRLPRGRRSATSRKGDEGASASESLHRRSDNRDKACLQIQERFDCRRGGAVTAKSW